MLLLIHVKVADYARWKTIFDERQPNRREHGAQRHWLRRSVDDPNDLIVSIEFSDADAARSYANDPGLREAIARAGVRDGPHFHILEEVEDVSY